MCLCLCKSQNTGNGALPYLFSKQTQFLTLSKTKQNEIQFLVKSLDPIIVYTIPHKLLSVVQTCCEKASFDLKDRTDPHGSSDRSPLRNKKNLTGGRRKSVWNFDGAHPVHYPLLPFPVQRSEMSSDLSSLPIRQSSLQFSDMLNRVRKDKITSGGTFNEGFQDFDEKTAQMVDHFGQRVRATVRQYEEAHGQRMKNVGKIMEQFKLDEVKDRLKKTLTDQKGLLKKLHSIGWRGKYIGVPYDTMNDDHKIVKKPGVYITSLSQPNAVLVAPAIQSIPVEHPALPEVTTSVYVHQESEPTATIDDYVLPPEVNDTTEISNSIDYAERLTTSKETIILQEDTRTETSPRIEDKPTTTQIGPTFPSTIMITNEENSSLDIEGYTTAAEIIPRYPPVSLTEVTPTEGTSSPVPETTQVPSEVIPITETASSSTTRNPGITSEIISTFSSIFSTEEPVATSDGEPITKIVTTYPPEISTESTSWSSTDSITPVVEVLSGLDYNTSPSFLDAIETSTGVSSILLFSTIPTESTTTKVDGEEIEEIITTLTEESETLEEVSITTEPVYDPVTTDVKTIAYYLMTSTSTIPQETTFWQPITSEATTSIESTFSSTIPSTEIYSTVNERLTTIDSGIYSYSNHFMRRQRFYRFFFFTIFRRGNYCSGGNIHDNGFGQFDH